MNDVKRSPTYDEDACVHGLSFMSGFRPHGKIVDHSGGRYKNGLLYLLSGNIVFSHGKDSLTDARAGNVVFIPKNEKYVLRYESDTEFILMDFNMSSPGGEAISLSNGITLISRESETEELKELFLCAKEISGEISAAAVFRGKEILHGILARIFLSEDPSFSFSTNFPKKIAAGVKMLHRKYLENIPITEFAAACYVSESLFRHLFSEYYGISPTQYRNRLRIKKADELLDSGNYTVSEISLLSGFKNESYFCRYYKKITGKTPTETRKTT